MIVAALKLLGWVAAHLPERVLAAGARAAGHALYQGYPRRRRLLLSNLQHAFPDRSREWRERVGRDCCQRLVETGLLSLAMPFLGESRVRGMLGAAPGLRPWLDATAAAARPQVALTPHFCYWEFETAIPLLYPGRPAEFGIIFRPLDHPAADRWVQQTRERFGMRLLSRKQGFSAALRLLRRRGCVGILFDQNAGMQGALTTLFGRVCSTSELPGLLVERTGADAWIIFTRRVGFWRAVVDGEFLGTGLEAATVTLRANRWLDSHLSASDDACASWLWLHDRWRHQDVPARRLRLESKRSLLPLELAAGAVLPRRTRYYVRMPNWLGDIVMALPLIRALARSRPDAEIILVAQPRYTAWLASLQLAGAVRPLPGRGWHGWREIHRWRRDYPDVWILLTNSARGDLEAWLAGAPQRLGIRRRPPARPLLTHGFVVPPDFAASHPHQLELWEAFFRSFGLEGPVDRTPLPRAAHRPVPGRIGLIPGSENFPAKRWPPAAWRAIIAALDDCEFFIFGTAADAPLVDAILGRPAPPRVVNRAGQTSLAEFAAELATCDLVVANDTGGMHLANLLGVPLVALFGPTNPRRTGPVFAGPVEILQPPGCAPTGGAPLAGLAPDTVIAAVRTRLLPARTPV